MTFIFSLVIFSLISLQYSQSETVTNSSIPAIPIIITTSAGNTTSNTTSNTTNTTNTITNSTSLSTASPSKTINMSELSGPTNNFGLRFFKHYSSSNENKNFLFSPLSTILAYGMLLEGATGQTEKEIKDVFHLSSIGNQTSDISAATKKLLTNYKSIEDGASNRNFSLAIGNLAMVNQKVNLKETYAKSLMDNYLAQATKENFDNGSAVVDKLNSWIAEKTKNKIQKILTSPPNPETILMLVNTVYFKGKWVEPFHKRDVLVSTFNNADGTTSNVKMMYLRDKKFNYAHHPDKKVKIIELPYNGNVSMYLIMPTESNTMTGLTSTLNETVLDELVKSMKSTKLSSTGIPKFKLEDTHKLHEILPLLGLNSAFSDTAQLPNIAEGSELKVSQSIQKALIEVDEEGTTAAAVTLIVTVLRMSYFTPEDFIADRPFLFMIKDNITGVNLFMGCMNKMPNTESPPSTPASPVASPPVQPTAANKTSV